MLTSLAIIVDTVCPVCVDTLSRTRVSPGNVGVGGPVSLFDTARK
jgi:hypothetical protein